MTNLVQSSKGLLVKGSEKLAKIISRDVEMRTIRVHSWQISQLFRKDLNLLIYKLFFLRKKAGMSSKIDERIADLCEEAERLEGITQRFEMPGKVLYDEVTFRLIGKRDDKIIEALMSADRSVTKMLNSDLAELTLDNLGPFYASFGRLKNLAFENHQYSKQTQPAVAG